MKKQSLNIVYLQVLFFGHAQNNLVCKLRKRNLENWQQVFFTSIHPEVSKNVKILLLIKKSSGNVFNDIPAPTEKRNLRRNWYFLKNKSNDFIY